VNTDLLTGLLNVLKPALEAAEPKAAEAAECDVVDAAAKVGARSVLKILKT
jgi:hypothetical protein